MLRPLLKRALYSALGDEAYALLRVPGYALRLRRAARALRDGAPVAYEARELRWAAGLLPRVGTFLDVGAYLGDWCVPIALAFPSVEVIALEPLPSSRRALQAVARLLGARVEVQAAAAGARRGTARIAVALVDGAPSPMGASLAMVPPAARRFEVQVERADVLLGGRRPQLIKIDVEGAEEAALEGLEQALAAKPAVICELWHQQGEPRARRDRVLAWMDARGFSAHVLDAAARAVPLSPERLEAVQREHTDYTNYVFLPR